jgi:putative transcriptional regulator
MVEPCRQSGHTGGQVSADNWTNHLLIAMPALMDADFAHSVTLVCEHGPDGALGIVLNKPSSMSLRDVLSQMKIDAHDEKIGNQPVLFGGPIRTDRGFVLHRPGGQWDSTHRISDLIQVTTSRDVLSAMARGEGPSDAYVALGFARWAAGQLEQEIRTNAWLPIPADERLLFDLPFNQRWQASWQMLGVQLAQLSPVAGNA